MKSYAMYLLFYLISSIVSLGLSFIIKSNSIFTKSISYLSTISTGEFGRSFIDQKNYILLDKFSNPINGNLTEAALQFVNFCDESFDIFLTEEMTNVNSESDRQKLGRIRYEVNVARRLKLIEADKILRSILTSGGIKQMEAKLQYYLTRSEIDMAFMVVLQLNIEDAQSANVTTAVQVLKHLETIINQQQDALVNPPVRLLRLLLRTDDSMMRKQMLRQKLLLHTQSGFISSGEIEAISRSSSSIDESTINSPAEILPTPVPQCENILVDAVQSWGKPDVTFQELEDTIHDVLNQMTGVGGPAETRGDMEKKCAVLIQELLDVKEEFELFLTRRSNSCSTILSPTGSSCDNNIKPINELTNEVIDKIT